MKTIEVRNIQPKARKRNGQTQQWVERNEYHADIIPGKQITIFGTQTNAVEPTDFCLTLKVGDTAVMDSYNLTYLGEIVSIGAKTVTLERYGRRQRLEIHAFTWRNWDLDLERIRDANERISQTI